MQSKNPEAVKAKKGRIMLLSKSVVCNSIELQFLKEQEAKGLLSNLIRIKIPILSDLPILKAILYKYKINAVIKKFLLARDKFMLEMHLRQPGFTYCASGPFPKNKERIKIFKEKGDSRHIYQKKLDKACFQHITYGDFKDLNRRTAADKVLHDKAFNIAKNPKYDGHQCGLASVVYKFFDKKHLMELIRLQGQRP